MNIKKFSRISQKKLRGNVRSLQWIPSDAPIKTNNPKDRPYRGKSKPSYQNRRSRCGKGPHNRQKSPTAEAVHHTCQTKGHYSSQCFSKSVSNVSSDDENDTASLNTVTLQSGSKSLTQELK